MTNQALEYVLKNRRSSRDFTIKAISKGEVQQLAWAAQGITGDDSKRTAPSAKGAYPLEVRISTGPMDDLQPAVWRYDPMSDSLVMVGEKDVRKALSDAAIGDQDWIATSPCIMTLFADVGSMSKAFEDQPPAGQRGERYTYLEAGCAAQNAMLQATAMGIGSVLVAGFDDDETSLVFETNSGMRPLLHLCFG